MCAERMLKCVLSSTGVCLSDPCTRCSFTHCGLNDVDVSSVRLLLVHGITAFVTVSILSLAVVLEGMTFVVLRMVSLMVDSAAIAFAHNLVFSHGTFFIVSCTLCGVRCLAVTLQ